MSAERRPSQRPENPLIIKLEDGRILKAPDEEWYGYKHFVNILNRPIETISAQVHKIRENDPAIEKQMTTLGTLDRLAKRKLRIGERPQTIVVGQELFVKLVKRLSLIQEKPRSPKILPSLRIPERVLERNTNAQPKQDSQKIDYELREKEKETKKQRAEKRKSKLREQVLSASSCELFQKLRTHEYIPQNVRITVGHHLPPDISIPDLFGDIQQEELNKSVLDNLSTNLLNLKHPDRDQLVNRARKILDMGKPVQDEDSTFSPYPLHNLKYLKNP